MFGIGFGELAVIVILAIILFGPEKLPDHARTAARVVRRFRDIANSTRDTIRTELGPEYADIELADLNPRKFVTKHIADAVADLDAQEQSVKVAPLAADERPPFDPDAT